MALAPPHLYPVLRQVGFKGQHLPGVDVGVVGLLEGLLQLLQLEGRKDGATGRRGRKRRREDQEKSVEMEVIVVAGAGMEAVNMGKVKIHLDNNTDVGVIVMSKR